MEKPKINQIESKEYEEGRIDLFVIEERRDFHNEIISLLSDIGFEEEKLNELDSNYNKDEGNYFVFSKGMRFYLFLQEDSIKFVIDSQIQKEELISKIEKYFQIF